MIPLIVERMIDRKGFTLIELMIVIAIIGVISALAIASILRSQMSANHTAAVSSMNTMLKMNFIFRQNDEDRNGVNDFWTEHVWGLHAIKNPDGEAIELIPRSVAEADFEGGDDDVTMSNASIEQMPDDPDFASPKSGYYFAMFTGLNNSGSGGSPCDTDYDDGDGGGVYTNKRRFSIQAFPALYDSTGIQAFAIPESGDVYRIDARQEVYSSGSDKFNASDGTPYGTKGETPPVTCLPSEGDLSVIWSISPE